LKLFIDANVLVAVLNRELPLFPDAARVLSLADKRPFELYTSPICLAIAWYFAEKKSGRKNAGKKISALCDHIHIAICDEAGVKNTLANPKINDFEDGLEYHAARSASCDAIVTENQSDFHFSAIRVFNCSDLLQHLAT
jgi:predicted nucleic acid-binding protein